MLFSVWTIRARTTLAIAVTLVVGAVLQSSSAEQGIVYYVQLVQGTDSETAPGPGAKKVGAKLREKFTSVCKWKNYWELVQQEAKVTPGQSGRVKLGADHE